MSEERYFLREKRDWTPWHEVPREVWISAERRAGFYPKGGGDGPATGGFSNGHIDGRIINDQYSTPEAYDFDPEFRDAAWPPEDSAPDELTRLREALERIASKHLGNCVHNDRLPEYCPRCIARRALAL